jgi:hypothetical protein
VSCTLKHRLSSRHWQARRLDGRSVPSVTPPPGAGEQDASSFGRPSKHASAAAHTRRVAVGRVGCPRRVVADTLQRDAAWYARWYSMHLAPGWQASRLCERRPPVEACASAAHRVPVTVSMRGRAVPFPSPQHPFGDSAAAFSSNSLHRCNRLGCNRPGCNKQKFQQYVGCNCCTRRCAAPNN